jgi:hypothetical protein
MAGSVATHARRDGPVSHATAAPTSSTSSTPRRSGFSAGDGAPSSAPNPPRPRLVPLLQGTRTLDQLEAAIQRHPRHAVVLVRQG